MMIDQTVRGHNAVRMDARNALNFHRTTGSLSSYLDTSIPRAQFESGSLQHGRGTTHGMTREFTDLQAPQQTVALP